MGFFSSVLGINTDHKQLKYVTVPIVRNWPTSLIPGGAGSPFRDIILGGCPSRMGVRDDLSIDSRPMRAHRRAH